jgi:uncharacterized protein YjbJ (UPF0337 family)
MNMFNSKENCNELKAKFKEQYTNVTDKDLRCRDGGSKEVMLGKLQQKLGKTGEELHEIILKLQPDFIEVIH